MPSRYKLETYRFFEATDRTEFEELSAGDRATYWSLLGLGVLDFREGSLAKTLLYECFGEGTTTRANFEELEKPPPIEE